MQIKKYISKLLFLFSKLKNPSMFIYLVYHYIQKDVPSRIALVIAKKNRKDIEESEKEFYVPTYDFSDQIVHPDAVIFNGKYWMIVTPYPYGMEEYENPCLYCGNSIEKLTPFEINPIDRQDIHKIGFHLSDPCLFYSCDKLFCAYRSNTRYAGKNNNIIYVKEITGSTVQKYRLKVLEADMDTLLSPAIVSEKNFYHMYHVRIQGGKGFLIHTKLDSSFKAISGRIVEIAGLPEDYYIWHIAVEYQNGKRCKTNIGRLRGLFLVRNCYSKASFRLYSAVSESNGSEWRLDKEITAPKNILAMQLHPYKSCFIPDSDQIIYSYIDKKNRYRLTIV